MDEPFHFAGKDLGQAKRPLGNRQVVSHPGALERVKKQETERGKLLSNRDGAQLAVPEQVDLILTYMFRPDLVGRLLVVTRELLAEPSQLRASEAGMPFVFNEGIPKVSTTF